MEQYHNYVSGEESHNKIIKKTRKLNLDQFNRKLMNKILKICSKNLNKNLTFRNPKLRKDHYFKIKQTKILRHKSSTPRRLFKNMEKCN